MRKLKRFISMSTLLHLCTVAISTETSDTNKKSGHPITLTSSTDELIAIESVVQPQTAMPPLRSKWGKDNVSIQKSLYEHVKKPRKAQSVMYDNRHELRVTNHDDYYDVPSHNISNDISVDNDNNKYPTNKNIDFRAPDGKVYHSDFVTADQSLSNSLYHNESPQSDTDSREVVSKLDNYPSSSPLSYTRHSSTERHPPYEEYETPQKKNCTSDRHESNDYDNSEYIVKDTYRNKNPPLYPATSKNQVQSVEGRDDIMTGSNFGGVTPHDEEEDKPELSAQPKPYLHMRKDAHGNMHYHVHNHQHHHNHLHGHKSAHLAGRGGSPQHQLFHNDYYRPFGKQQPTFGFSYAEPYNNYGVPHYILQEIGGSKPNFIDLNRFHNNAEISGENHQSYRPIGSNDESYNPSEKKMKVHEYNTQYSKVHADREKKNHGDYHGYNYDNGVSNTPSTGNAYPEHSKHGPKNIEDGSYTSSSAEHTSAEEDTSHTHSGEQPNEFHGKGSSKDTISNDEYHEKHPNHNYKYNNADSEDNQSSDDYKPGDERYAVHYNVHHRNHENAHVVSNNGHNYNNNNNNIQHSPGHHEVIHHSPPMIKSISSTGGRQYGVHVTQSARNSPRQQEIINPGFSYPVHPEPQNGQNFVNHENNFASTPANHPIPKFQNHVIPNKKVTGVQNPLVLPRNARIIEHHIGLPPILFKSFETPVVLGHSVRYAVHKIVPNPLKISAFHQNLRPQVRNVQALQTQQHLTLFPKWL